MEALARLHSTVVAAYRVNPNITFEVFIHKVDGLSEDYKIGELLVIVCSFAMTTRRTRAKQD